MILALVAVLAASRVAQDVRIVRAELAGPLESVEVSAGAAATRVRASLGPGETRAETLPVRGAGEPRVGAAYPAGARVRLLGAAPAARVPPALRARPRPRPRGVPRPGVAAALVAGAALAGVLAARRRPGRALALGAAGALVAGALPVRAPATGMRVLEGDAGDAWLVVDCGWEEVRTPPGEWVDVAADRAGADVALSVDARPDEALWTARARAAGVSVRRAVDGRELAPIGAVGLAEVWTRTPDGAWSARAAWLPGGALGEGRPGAPPGVLAAGLPMGVEVLVARLAGDLPGLGAPARGGVWLRRTGPLPEAGTTVGTWISD